MSDCITLRFNPFPSIQAWELVEVFSICGSIARMAEVHVHIDKIPDYLLQHFIDAQGCRWQRDGSGYYKLDEKWQPSLTSLTERERHELLHGVWQS